MDVWLVWEDQSIPRSVWEKIKAFDDLPQHISIAAISLDLAISPLCQFLLGLITGGHQNGNC